MYSYSLIDCDLLGTILLTTFPLPFLDGNSGALAINSKRKDDLYFALAFPQPKTDI